MLWKIFWVRGVEDNWDLAEFNDVLWEQDVRLILIRY